jgi:hypothetical protein
MRIFGQDRRLGGPVGWRRARQAGDLDGDALPGLPLGLGPGEGRQTAEDQLAGDLAAKLLGLLFGLVALLGCGVGGPGS